MIDSTFLDQLGKFSLIVQKRVSSNYSGARLSTAHGRGIVLKDHRIYTPGDDFRAIDWKVYGRTDKLHIRTFEEERNLNVHVIIDSSASMDFGGKVTKFDYASMLGVGFAYIGMKQNEKVQYASFSENLHYFKPRRGMHQIASMIDHLNAIKPEGESLLNRSLVQYKKYISSKSYIVIISDFLLDINEVKKALPRFGNHYVVVIQVLDPREISLAIEGDLKLHDSETKSILHTFVTPRLRQHYQAELKDHILKIEEECTALGYKYFLTTTDKPVFDLFWEILR